MDGLPLPLQGCIAEKFLIFLNANTLQVLPINYSFVHDEKWTFNPLGEEYIFKHFDTVRPKGPLVKKNLINALHSVIFWIANDFIEIFLP